MLLWAVAVAVAFLVVVYPAVPPGWAGVLTQLVAYALLTLPVIVLRPRAVLPIGAGPLATTISAVVLATALVVLTASGPDIEAAAQHLARGASAGIGEELLFRGPLLDRLHVVIRSTPALALVDGLLFGAYHVPVVLLQHGSAGTLLVHVGFGVVFTALRLLSGGLLLPTALHVAVDLV